MNTKCTYVAVFNSSAGADKVVRALHKYGFDMATLSLVAHDSHVMERVLGRDKVDNKPRNRGVEDPFWKEEQDFLLRSAFFQVHGLGSIVVAGPLVAQMVASLEEKLVPGGLTILGAGLSKIGVPKHSIIDHEDSLSAGKCLLIATGSPAQVKVVRDMVKVAHPETTRQHIYETNISDIDLISIGQPAMPT